MANISTGFKDAPFKFAGRGRPMHCMADLSGNSVTDGNITTFKANVDTLGDQEPVQEQMQKMIAKPKQPVNPYVQFINNSE